MLYIRASGLTTRERNENTGEKNRGVQSFL